MVGIVRTVLGAGMLLALSAQPRAGFAQQDQAARLVGDWSNVLISENGAPNPGCRAIVVTKRTYALSRGSNNEVHGTYSRNISLVHLGNRNSNCPGPPIKPTDFRIDTWNFFGTIRADGSIVARGVAPSCQGQCTESVVTADDFSTKLVARDGLLFDLGNSDPNLMLRFVKTDMRDTDEAEAARAFPSLVQPLLNNDCNTFYADSLDISVRLKIKPDMYCGVLTHLADLVGSALYSKPVMTFRMSLGIFNAPDLGIAGDGDVLTIRRFTLDSAGNNMELGAVMKRQGDGSWRIKSLVF